MTTRRSFLSLLGIGSVSAPLAAKAAVDASAAELTSLAGNYAPALAGGTGFATSGQLAPDQASKTYIKMSDYLRVFGRLPEHIERDVRERTKHVSFLDPDIACKRSWSLSVKILAQRQRNYEAEVERYRRMGWYEAAQLKFEKFTGFRWQW